MRIQASQLGQLTQQLFVALGYESATAGKLAEHLVAADLCGHHSHGVIRFPLYYQRVTQGRIDPLASAEVESVSPTLVRINAHGQLGQIACVQAADLVIEKAQHAGVATAVLYNIDHTGRLGAYVEQMAAANMIGMVFCNGCVSFRGQAPYGGKEARLSTNPMAFAAPLAGQAPIVLDMATTALSHGNIMVCRNTGRPIAPNCALDQDGNVTLDPQAYFAGGTLLPLGGEQGYKGFGLSLMIEIVAGILSQARLHSQETIQDHNGVLMLALNVNHYLPLEAYFAQITAMVDELKSSALRDGFDEILLPGERSSRMVQRQRKQGIELNDKTWHTMEEYAHKLAVDFAPYQR
jgi:LDH2 family malate/lactate/ureidoglycolate dehydrogenase